MGNRYPQRVIRGNMDHVSSDLGDPQVDSWTALDLHKKCMIINYSKNVEMGWGYPNLVKV